jgi:hypothetical protein
MAAAGKGRAERASRALKTVWFVVALLASLLVASAPALVAAGDVAVALWLEVRLPCLRCHGLRDHLQRYSFQSSLADIPLVSVVRSLIITCKPRFPLAPQWCFSERFSCDVSLEELARLSWISIFFSDFFGCVMQSSFSFFLVVLRCFYIPV